MRMLKGDIFTMVSKVMSKPYYLLRTHPLSPAHKWLFPQIRVFQGLTWIFTTVFHHARTLLLFTYTDYKTIFIPVVSNYLNHP